MKKLKIILKYSYILIILFTIIYAYNYITKEKYKSKYNVNSTYVEGYVKEIKEKDNKLTIIIDDVLINFYNDKIPKNIKIGDYLKIEGVFSIPNKNTTPHLFNYRFYLYSMNIHYILMPKNYKIVKKKYLLYII